MVLQILTPIRYQSFPFEYLRNPNSLAVFLQVSPLEEGTVNLHYKFNTYHFEIVRVLDSNMEYLHK